MKHIELEVDDKIVRVDAYHDGEIEITIQRNPVDITLNKHQAKEFIEFLCLAIKSSGGPIDPDAKYFVLRVDTDPAAQKAMITYAIEMEKIGSLNFANQIREWVGRFIKK